MTLEQEHPFGPHSHLVGAVIYCRISDDRAGAGLGVARQEKDCRAVCEAKGWDVAEVVVDNDRSAYSGRKRPGYERLLVGLKERAWDAVVVWHPDRLHRSPKELETFIDVLEASGATVVTVTAGELDLSTPTGRMTARVVGAVARHESEHKAERTRRKHRELAEAGKPAGGGIPFGWADRISVHPEQAALVRSAAQRLLDGGTLRGIVMDWEERGIAAPGGGRWHSLTVRRMLTSPRIAGYREYGGKLYDAEWDAVLDEISWRRLRALLLDPGRRAALAPRKYLLTGGIAVCGLCGAALVARPKQDHRRCYVCASGPMFDGCGGIRILAAAFEADVEKRVLTRLAGAVVTPPDTGRLSVVLAELEGVESSIAELANDYYSARAITKVQFQAASATLTARAGLLQAEAGQLERAPVLDRSVAADWADRSVEQKRPTVSALVEAVVVGRAVKGQNFYNRERVEIRWR